MENIDYTFASGTAEDWYYQWEDGDIDDNWRIALYNIEPNGSDPFAFGAYSSFDTDYLCIIVSVPKVNAIGVHQLSFNISTCEGFTVTLYNTTTNINSVCTNGAVEITAVDLEAQTISGRMDVWYNSRLGTTSANGNFTVPIDPAYFQ